MLDALLEADDKVDNKGLASSSSEEERGTFSNQFSFGKNRGTLGLKSR